MYPLYVEAAFRNRGSPCSVGCRKQWARWALWTQRAGLVVLKYLATALQVADMLTKHIYLP